MTQFAELVDKLYHNLLGSNNDISEYSKEDILLAEIFCVSEMGMDIELDDDFDWDNITPNQAYEILTKAGISLKERGITWDYNIITGISKK